MENFIKWDKFKSFTTTESFIKSWQKSSTPISLQKKDFCEIQSTFEDPLEGELEPVSTEEKEAKNIGSNCRAASAQK